MAKMLSTTRRKVMAVKRYDRAKPADVIRPRREAMTDAASTAVRTRFAGWSKPALQFFHGLKRDNSKAYFEAHRQVYEEQVRQPMEALLTEIERDLGPDIEVKVFRLNRDLRFTPDKRPYKEHLGAYLSTAGAGGLYLQIRRRPLPRRRLARDGVRSAQ